MNSADFFEDRTRIRQRSGNLLSMANDDGLINAGRHAVLADLLDHVGRTVTLLIKRMAQPP